MSDLGREGEGLAQRIGMRGHECLDLRLILLVEQRAGRVQEQSFAREQRPQRIEQSPLPLAKRGNVVPVISDRVLDQEGPEFAATVNRVTALLTLPAIRELNAAVDLGGEDPATAARRFLVDHGVIPPSSSVS